MLDDDIIVNHFWEIHLPHGTAILEKYSKDKSMGQSVLLIHGFASSREMWFEFEDSIGTRILQEKENCNVYGLDLSEPVLGNIKDLAEDVYQAIKIIHNYDSLVKTNSPKIKVLCHSMGGLVTRVMTKPELFDKANTVAKWIDDINLLAVPNHGVKPVKTRRILNIIKKLQDIAVEKQFEMSMQQMEFQSKLLKKLNKESPVLHPDIHWRNAIAQFDDIVETTSAEFSSTEISKNISPYCSFEQRYFDANHMTFPFGNYLNKLGTFTLPKQLQRLEDPIDNFKELFKNLQYPAISRSDDVFNWIFSD